MNENEVGDNWLEDDIGKQPNKKRKSNSSTSLHNSSYKPLSVKNNSSSRLSLNSCSSSRLSSPSAHSIGACEDQRWSTGSTNSEAVEMDMNVGNFEDSEMQMANEDIHYVIEDSW